MECGACNEVLRRVMAIKALASEAEAGIRIGGVVDRDFRTDANVSTINGDGVFVLPVHEVENFFIHPATLAALLQQNGRTTLVPTSLIREAADARAGSWVFQHTMATQNAKSLPGISVAAKERAKVLTWAQLDADWNAAIQGIVDTSGYDAGNQRKLRGLLKISTKSYADKRNADNFWKICEGKQVLNDVARSTGFAGAPALIQATFVAWARDGAQIPEELMAFREYLATL